MVAHDGDNLAKGMRERKMPEREIDLAKGGKREKKRRPDLVAAYDGDDWCGDGGLWRSNEGSMRRETLGKRKKNEEGEETEKNRERDVT